MKGKHYKSLTYVTQLWCEKLESFLKHLCSEPVVSFENLNKQKPIEMELHLEPRFFLLINTAE